MTERKAARSVGSKHKIARRFAARRLVPDPCFDPCLLNDFDSFSYSNDKYN